jgi:hypothetical protein
MKTTPLIGNVYLLSPRVVVSRALFELCQKHAQSADGGNAFFSEFAARQIAVYRGLGYRGVYLGGVHNFPAIEEILAIEKTFAPDDWKQFAREIKFSRPGEFFTLPKIRGRDLPIRRNEIPVRRSRPSTSRRFTNCPSGRTTQCSRLPRRSRNGARGFPRIPKIHFKVRSRCARWSI